MLDAETVEYDCKCGTCGDPFKLKSKIGPSKICDRCVEAVISILHGEAVHRDPVYGIVTPVGRSSIG